MNEEQHMRQLLDRYVTDPEGLSRAENDRLFELIANGKYDDMIGEHIDLGFSRLRGSGDATPSRRGRVWLICKNTLRRLDRRWLSGVAAVLLCVSIGHFVIQPKHDNGMAVVRPIDKDPNGYKTMQVKNEGKESMQFRLDDGSFVTLSPQSQLVFTKPFAGNHRTVHLVGEAFFDVQGDPAWPFLVHHNGLVTKVLGTRFKITSLAGSLSDRVAVISGKVAVYASQGDDREESQGALRGVQVTPNQQVTYLRTDSVFSVTLVDEPLPVTEPAMTDRQAGASGVFSDSPLADVAHHLMIRYAIEVRFADDALSRCRFSGNLSGMGLYAQLHVLTKAVGATYAVDGTRIVISGNGCKQ